MKRDIDIGRKGEEECHNTMISELDETNMVFDDPREIMRAERHGQRYWRATRFRKTMRRAKSRARRMFGELPF